MENKSVNDLRLMFNVQNDFSDEELEQLNKEKDAYDQMFPS